MFVVGLTGGIGSGKTAVANLFAERGGIHIIDADIVARQVTQPEKPAFASILKHFGNSVLLSDGTLNRSRLRAIIFEDSKQRLWLENLLHPQIRAIMHEEVKKLTAPYAIAVIPLLLEVEFYSFINRILVIDTPESAQLERVMARDNLTKPQVEAILNTQASRSDRKARAHDVIMNDGILEDLIPQVDKLHQLYLQLSQQNG